MKKIYEKPFAEKLVFDSRDIITAQSGRTFTHLYIEECVNLNDNFNFHPGSNECHKIKH